MGIRLQSKWCKCSQCLNHCSECMRPFNIYTHCFFLFCNSRATEAPPFHTTSILQLSPLTSFTTQHSMLRNYIQFSSKGLHLCFSHWAGEDGDLDLASWPVSMRDLKFICSRDCKLLVSCFCPPRTGTTGVQHHLVSRVPEMKPRLAW